MLAFLHYATMLRLSTIQPDRSQSAVYHAGRANYQNYIDSLFCMQKSFVEPVIATNGQKYEKKDMLKKLGLTCLRSQKSHRHVVRRPQRKVLQDLLGSSAKLQLPDNVRLGLFDD